ncbi:MAG: DEAD/DEAH box helicase [Thermoguttaceae bacterium]|nr:DEAD/DEAH box helicase [Thermoguttaceae bacterium]MDW8080068.1 DEAD/DEAH box helicase [Thermoguttaceae bacterium]
MAWRSLKSLVGVLVGWLVRLWTGLWKLRQQDVVVLSPPEACEAQRHPGVNDFSPLISLSQPNILVDAKLIHLSLPEPLSYRIVHAKWQVPKFFVYDTTIPSPQLDTLPIPQWEEPQVLGQLRLRRRDLLRFKRSGQVWPPPPAIPEDKDLWEQIWAILSPPPRIDELVQIRYPFQLRGYQVEGVKLLIENERYILADEMGTGKTVQACVALSLLIQLGRIDRALILCPKTVMPVWIQHLMVWVPEAICHTYKDKPKNFSRDRPHIWVIPYSRIRRDDAHLLWQDDWDAVVMDEVHELRNPGTKGYKAVCKIISNARYRWGLSGTPIQNRLEDLSAIFAILRPELNLKAEELGPAQTREMIRPYLRRVRRADVLAELPPKRRLPIWLTLDAAQRKAYEAIEKEHRLRAAEGTLDFTAAWEAINRLKRICNFAPGSSTSPKLTKLLELVRDIVRKGEKVVVFSHFRESGVDNLIQPLEQFGLAVIHGQVPMRERLEAIRRFQTDPSCRVFLGTIFTSGQGLSLTAANHVVHFDHWWNPAVVWQAEDRVYRFGQNKPVTVYDLWMKNTVEERILMVLEKKGLLHHEVIEALARKDVKKLLTLEDLAVILGLEVKAKAGRAKKKR